jgi:hypothetical protein
MAPTDKVEVSLFDATRLKAINSYASLEFVLSLVLAALLRIDHALASIVFFRVTNTRSRYAIIFDLLRKRYGSQFTPFWKSLEGKLSALDNRRNNIIHWLHVASVSLEQAAGGVETETALRPQHRFVAGDDSDKVTVETMEEFATECLALGHLVAFFRLP